MAEDVQVEDVQVQNGWIDDVLTEKQQEQLSDLLYNNRDIVSTLCCAKSYGATPDKERTIQFLKQAQGHAKCFLDSVTAILEAHK